ncbi:hypothetical protein [Duffyella gerundensis]|uniref:hypothetical protein n=1 Tax=Duffyella gerundensis TaxID=1619313 RepID=UPI00165408A8|nr:hypothetical protein [Duffyella gerundensis]
MADFLVFKSDGSTDIWQGEGYQTTHITFTDSITGDHKSYTTDEFTVRVDGETLVYLIAYSSKPDDEVIIQAIINHEIKPVEMRK